MATVRSPAGLSVSHQGKARCKQAGEGATKNILLGFVGFHIFLGESIPFSIFKSQTNKSEKSGLFCKCCSQLLKKGYEFSKCKRFQIKLIYFRDLVARLRNYVLLKTCWVRSCNASPCSF